MEEKTFELIEKMYNEFGKRFDALENDVKDLKDQSKKNNVIIEHEIAPKITSLFDGYKQNSDMLSRIESEVSKHEEIILRRIK